MDGMVVWGILVGCCVIERVVDQSIINGWIDRSIELKKESNEREPSLSVQSACNDYLNINQR
jgi:hypothetical protein